MIPQLVDCKGVSYSQCYFIQNVCSIVLKANFKTMGAKDVFWRGKG